MTPVTARALTATVPSYLRLMGPVIAAPHGSWRVAKASCWVAVAVRALVAYSLWTGDVLDTAGDFLGMAVSVCVHHIDDDGQAVWRLVVAWADDEFAHRMLVIVAPNLLIANVTVHPIIGMCINLRIKYIWYFGTNLKTTGKFELSAVSILSMFEHAGLPPAPTLLLVDDDDNRSDHFDNPRWRLAEISDNLAWRRAGFQGWKRCHRPKSGTRQ
jgi:hypothetical protein